MYCKFCEQVTLVHNPWLDTFDGATYFFLFTIVMPACYALTLKEAVSDILNRRRKASGKKATDMGKVVDATIGVMLYTEACVSVVLGLFYLTTGFFARPTSNAAFCFFLTQLSGPVCLLSLSFLFASSEADVNSIFSSSTFDFVYIFPGAGSPRPS